MEVLTRPDARTLTRTIRGMLDGDEPGPLAVVADAARLERITQSLDGVDVILGTSGSTDGTGHLVGLSFVALTASATATHDRFGGPGQWLDTLPTDHVAGFQVAFRSALAGTTPLRVERWDDADALRRALTDADPDLPVYASFVPAQLRRLLETAPEALSRLNAVLIGGAALPSPVAERAAAAGVRVVRSYGMTESCGGCVYDGAPLNGVRVRIEAGLVQIGGQTLMTRYLDADSQPFVVDDGERWLTTADLAELDDDGTIAVLGRADDVIISGGVNVPPRPIEECLEAALGGAWAVVGVPDEQWGQRVVAVTDTAGIELDDVRRATLHLEPAFRPRQIAVAPLPRTGLGKLDRRALRERLTRET